MRGILISVCASLYLFGASAGDPQSILNEVVKLRQKYDECRAGQSAVLGVAPEVYTQCDKERKESTQKLKGYQTRLSVLDLKIQQKTDELERLKKHNRDIERELSQKKGVIQSLEKTLNDRDKKYREAAARNEFLAEQENAAKIGRIERKKLTDALTKAKSEIERLEHASAKSAQEKSALEKKLSETRFQADKFRSEKHEGAVADQSRTIKSLQEQLSQAKGRILELQNTPSSVVTKEKVVTKIVEPTDKINALQRELSAAQATILSLKSTPTAAKEKIVEKVVYRDRPVEKIVEKVVYKDRPVVQERVVTKVVEPTEKIASLQRELSKAQAKIVNLRSSVPDVVVKEKIVEKVVYKDRPVEKIVYKDRPVVQERIVTKVVEPTDKLKSLQHKPAPNVQSVQSKEATQKEKKAVIAIQENKASAVSGTPKKGTSSAYRMAVNGPIFNAPGGEQIDTWEARRSFTAGNPSNGWVHITGYFVNRVWTATGEGEKLWVRESDVIRR